MPRLPQPFRTTPKPTERQWASRQGDERGWYATIAWRRLRSVVLERDAWICQACKRPAGKSAHCDHITPHKGRWELFIDEANLQCLCSTCHSRKTAIEDGGFGHEKRRMIYVVTGKPASGKTTWVKQRSKPGDLVWDTDAVAATVFGMPHYPRPAPIAESLAYLRGAALRCVKDISGDVYVIETDREQAARLCAAMGATLQVIECDETVRLDRLRQRNT